MATIIDNTYFINELSLPIDNISVQNYIDAHEPDILDKVLGVELSNEFATEISGVPSQKWIDLRDGKIFVDLAGDAQRYKGIKSIIADYVFIKIVFDKQNYTTDSGIKRGNTENAENITPRDRIEFAQNDMAKRFEIMDDFINVNILDYPSYLPTKIKKINTFDI